MHAVDLNPADGTVGIAELARQIDEAARGFRDEPIDLIGFSMGALVGRYWLQRMAGRERTSTFVSISGPHSGTALAHLLKRAGIVDMRPGSALLADLDSDAAPFRGVDVHVFYTPFDLMIVPPRSSVLVGAKAVRSFPVLLHPWMLSDRRVIAATLEALAQPDAAKGSDS